jgi:hypothetical protein
MEQTQLALAKRLLAAVLVVVVRVLLEIRRHPAAPAAVARKMIQL